jgi:hypothetical protein
MYKGGMDGIRYRKRIIERAKRIAGNGHIPLLHLLADLV